MPKEIVHPLSTLYSLLSTLHSQLPVPAMSPFAAMLLENLDAVIDEYGVRQKEFEDLFRDEDSEVDDPNATGDPPQVIDGFTKTPNPLISSFFDPHSTRWCARGQIFTSRLTTRRVAATSEPLVTCVRAGRRKSIAQNRELKHPKGGEIAADGGGATASRADKRPVAPESAVADEGSPYVTVAYAEPAGGEDLDVVEVARQVIPPGERREEPAADTREHASAQGQEDVSTEASEKSATASAPPSQAAGRGLVEQPARCRSHAGQNVGVPCWRAPHLVNDPASRRSAREGAAGS
jgi:hypothetical protein